MITQKQWVILEMVMLSITKTDLKTNGGIGTSHYSIS